MISAHVVFAGCSGLLRIVETLICELMVAFVGVQDVAKNVYCVLFFWGEIIVGVGMTSEVGVCQEVWERVVNVIIRYFGDGSGQQVHDIFVGVPADCPTTEVDSFVSEGFEDKG